jgi:hypothetical protein
MARDGYATRPRSVKDRAQRIRFRVCTPAKPSQRLAPQSDQVHDGLVGLLSEPGRRHVAARRRAARGDECRAIGRSRSRPSRAGHRINLHPGDATATVRDHQTQPPGTSTTFTITPVAPGVETDVVVTVRAARGKC